jgi:hypothetical protein
MSKIITIPKCAHGVYCPDFDKRHCSVCGPTVPGVATVRNIRTASSWEFINSADTTLPSIPKGDSDEFDEHQFQKRNQETEFGTLAELFAYNPAGVGAMGFTVGQVRGAEGPVRARRDAPWWTIDTRALRDFIKTRKHGSRAAAVLYLYFRCGLSDGEVAKRCTKMTQAAAKKFRQRLIEDGNDYFASQKQAA